MEAPSVAVIPSRDEADCKPQANPPRIVSRLGAVVVVFALAIQFVNGFELLSVFGNILYFPRVEALPSSSTMFINLKDIALELIDVSCKGLYMRLQRPELISVGL